MSRSYKKHPYCKDWNRRKSVGKKLANAKVRAQIKRGVDIPNGKAYRKVYETWDIYDYHWRETLQEAIQYWELNKSRYQWYQDMTFKEVKNDWARLYYRK